MSSIRLAALAAFLAVAVAELPKGWVSLFPPPYDNAPSVMLSMGCVDSNLCYVAGGGNNIGFDVFAFDGQPNGNFTGLNMPDMDLMLMGIGVGGTSAAPKGVVGGVGLGDGLQYFVNKTTLLPSSQPFLVVTQDIRATKDGNNIIVVDSGGSNSVLYSTNAGKNFTNLAITSLMPNNETLGRYGAIADMNTWYITLGGWPSGSSSSSGSKTEVHVNPLTKWVKGEKEWRRVRTPRPLEVPGETGYSCVIAKTTDAGLTWHNVMYEAKNYYPNGIDCISPTHCVAVGEGFNEKAGGHVWVTFDGLVFTETLHLKDNSSGEFSIMSVAFNGENEVWVGGSFNNQQASTGIIYVSKDGGLTWTANEQMEFMAEISNIDFTADGVGFANAMTTFQTCTILRYDATGPPQTPAPTWNGPVSQVQCSDDNCAVNCTTVTFPQNVCQGLNGGGSAIAQCTGGMLEQWVFPFSSNCTGLNEMQPMPINQCLVAGNGGSFENFCSAVGESQHGLMMTQKKH